ncbi:O-antigen ligase family protein [uncultured Cytophaga sp.]|uniref:O-antigen ligase family protein n=1 Tax=uncultured Cytophaga sp. TaxID=160238 RepID=UPI00261E111F|nr:O-antigen ligase family protein [uncultured Cytophaga sp.]
MKLLVENTSNPTLLNRWFIASACIALIGIFFSRAMISIGMIGIILIYVLNQGWKINFLNHSGNRVLLFLAPILIIYLIGGVWTEDYEYWGERIQVKIPLLFLPLGFIAVKDVLKRESVDLVILLFIALCAATALGSFIYYLLHYAEITESYKHAKTIPTIIEHIRYSLLLSIACFASAQAYFQSTILKTNLQKRFIAGLGIFIFVFLHILSIRSGLLALYATIFVWILIKVIQNGNKNLLGLIPVFFAFLFAMYWFVPSLHNKVNYMVRDINQFATGKSVNNYSDGNRLLSMKIGVQVGMQSPWFGVGSGDVQQAMNQVYKNEYPDITPNNWLIPHNQFVYVFSALGLFGLIVFLGCLTFPLFNKAVMTDVFCVAVLVGVYTSFLSEATLEVQQGIVLASLLFSIAYIRVCSKI